MEDEDHQNSIEYTHDKIIIKNTFIMSTKDKLGAGAFGEVYLGYNVKTNVKLAFKLEMLTTKSPQLSSEYRLLKHMQGIEGFPTVHNFTHIGDDSILIMDLLGKNLETLMKESKSKKLSLKSVLMIAEQLLTRLNHLHDKDFIHRDLKPENCVIGLNNCENLIHLIDFGLAKRYKDAKTKEHIPYKDGRSIVGTVKYVSIYTHFGIEQSRRDDMESLGYILVYLVKGLLPWQGMKAKTREEKFQMIMNKKTEVKPMMLCKGLPEEFRKYFEYVRAISFTKRPDYGYLKGLFKKVMEKLDLVNDLRFEWSMKVEPFDFYKEHVPKYDMAMILGKLESLKRSSTGNGEDNENEEM